MGTLIVFHHELYRVFDHEDPFILGCIVRSQNKLNSNDQLQSESLSSAPLESELGMVGPYIVPTRINGIALSKAVEKVLHKCKVEMENRYLTIAKLREQLNQEHEHSLMLEKSIESWQRNESFRKARPKTKRVMAESGGFTNKQQLHRSLTAVEREADTIQKRGDLVQAIIKKMI